MREPLLSPHNMYLLVLSEQGLVGMLAFAFLLGSLAVAILRRRQLRRPGAVAPPEHRFLALVAPAILVWTVVDFLYADVGGPPTVLMAVMLGLVVRHGLIAAPDEAGLAAPAGGVAAPAGGLAAPPGGVAGAAGRRNPSARAPSTGSRHSRQRKPVGSRTTSSSRT